MGVNRNAMTETTKAQRVWFLKDEPLSNLQGQDRFGHQAYVNTLVATIEELVPPFTLGVFGSWGVGKSSIINELCERLRQRSPALKAVTIDVWKYGDNSLRRQFLYDLLDGLHGQEALTKGKDYVEEVYLETIAETPGKQRFDFNRIKTLAVPLVFTFILTLIGIGLFHLLNISTPLQAVLAAFVAPAALFFVSEFSRKLVVVSRTSVVQPVYFSEDQFERKFEEIVKDAKCKKLVIVVDNLDRCSHELVVDTLSAIKTFLEPKGIQKCIFLIPCDDNAIRMHVKAAYRVFSGDPAGGETTSTEPYAAEYLRKFFNASIKIDPFLQEEIEPYIRHLLSQIKLAENMPEQEMSDLIQMVGFLFRENPRQLKQFLNNLTSKYLVAKEREAGPSPQINPPITDNRLFLAKVVAIETRFPEIYKRFSNDDNLFSVVHSAAIAPSQANESGQLLSSNEGSDVLENFLRTTGHISADNPKAFFHLKQSEQEARIPNYTHFDQTIRQGDIEGARRAYNEGNTETNAARTDVLIRNGSEWAQKGYVTYALNAARVAVAAREFPTIDGEYISREVIRTFATIPRLLSSIGQFRNPDALLEMSECALRVHRRTVQDAYIDLLSNGLASPQSGQDSDDQLEDFVAESLVRHLGSLSSQQKGVLRSAISMQAQVRPSLLDILSSTKEAKDSLIDRGSLRKALDSIGGGYLSEFLNGKGRGRGFGLTFRVLIRCQDLGDRDLGSATALKLAELLKFATSQGASELFWYTSAVTSELGHLLDLADPEHLARIISFICDGYPSAEQEHLSMLVKLMCRHYGQVTADETNRIDSILNSEYIPSGPTEPIANLLVLHQDPSYADAPWDQIRGSLSQRLAAEGDDSAANELMEAIVVALAPNDLEYLMSLASIILEEHETQRAVILADHALENLPKNNKGKGLATPVLEGTLSLSGQAGKANNKKLLLELAFRHSFLHTKAYEAKLDDHILKLFAVDNPSQHVAWDALESAKASGVLPVERFLEILRRVSDWLVQQPASTPLQVPMPHILASIVSLKDQLLAAADRREKMIQWLSDRQDESLPAEERQETLRLLVNLGPLPRAVLDDLVPKLVSQAQHPPDERTRDAIAGSLIDLYKDNDPSNQDSWVDLNDYRRWLLNGDDSQKSLGRRINREMRRIRRTAENLREGNASEA